MDFLSACRAIVAADSTPGRGTEDVIKTVCSWLQPGEAVKAHVFEDPGGVPGQVNVMLSCGEPGEVDTLFQAHLDTVEPGPRAAWIKTGANPFRATIEDGRIFGLGAADAKLDFVCKLFALRELSKTQVNPRIGVVGTFGEETGMTGMTKFLRRRVCRPRRAIVGAATSLRLVHAGKGIAGVEIGLPFSEDEKAYRERHDLMDGVVTQSRVFRGLSAHSSSPADGDNAVMKMLQHLVQLPSGLAVMNLEGGINFNSVPAHASYEVDFVGDLRDGVTEKLKRLLNFLKQLESEFLVFRVPSFDPPYPTLTVGFVQSFADEVVLRGNFRWPPGVPDGEYRDWMQRLKDLCAEVGGRLQLFEVMYPFATQGDSEWVTACQDVMLECGLHPDLSTTGICSEANLLSRMGVDCVMFGPGEVSRNLHTPNEAVRLDELEAAMKFYVRMMERLSV